MSRFFLVGLVSFFTFAIGLFAAPKPPNDDFADRIVLEGNSVAFSGTLAGASAEPREVPGGQSVWWSWTAPETLPVTIEFWKISRDTPFNNSDYTWLTIYNPSNLALGFPTNDFPVTPVAKIVFLPNNIHPTLTFTGYAGQTYQFQLMAGNVAADYEMSLTATNNPIIRQHPQTTSASEHESVLFTVAAVGGMPMTYRWLFEGVPLNEVNGPTLPINDVDPTNAGNYSVIISNFAGVSTSQVAHLYVNAITPPPRLDFSSQESSNTFSVRLTGEPGRFYRVETTTNFMQWKAETNFVSRHFPDLQPTTNKFVYSSNGVATFNLPSVSSQKFVRAVRYAPSNEVCNIQLKEIQFLKRLWAIQTTQSHSSTPSDPELFSPLNIPKPRCPSGGWYEAGQVGFPVQCSVPGHRLEEPQ